MSRLRAAGHRSQDSGFWLPASCFLREQNSRNRRDNGLISFCRKTPIRAPEGRPESSRGRAARFLRRAAPGYDFTSKKPWRGARSHCRIIACRPCRGLPTCNFLPGAARFALAPGYSLRPLRGRHSGARYREKRVSRQILISQLLFRRPPVENVGHIVHVLNKAGLRAQCRRHSPFVLCHFL